MEMAGVEECFVCDCTCTSYVLLSCFQEAGMPSVANNVICLRKNL